MKQKGNRIATVFMTERCQTSHDVCYWLHTSVVADIHSDSHPLPCESRPTVYNQQLQRSTAETNLQSVTGRRVLAARESKFLAMSMHTVQERRNATTQRWSAPQFHTIYGRWHPPKSTNRPLLTRNEGDETHVRKLSTNCKLWWVEGSSIISHQLHSDIEKHMRIL